MPVGQPRSFHKRFKFTIEWGGLTYAGFQTCTEPKMSVGTVTHREGGTLIADKTPGLVTTEPITLTQGATNDQELWAKFKRVVDASANGGTGLNDGEYDDEIDIVQRDRDGSELVRIRLYEAWIKSYSAGSWDNDAEEAVVRTIEIEYSRFDFIPV